MFLACLVTILMFCLFVWVDALRPRSTAEVMSERSVILSTLFLGKPLRGSLPEYLAHILSPKLTTVFLESGEEEEWP